MSRIRTGLERLLTEPDLRRPLAGRRLGLLANQSSVTPDLRHAVDALLEVGLDIARLFGPEHGVRGHAQDMEAVAETVDPVTGIEVCSLYGADRASLAPRPAQLADLDAVLVDVPDIGTRYYTFAATAAYLTEVARGTFTEVWVLDRPNPLGGVAFEGNLVSDGFESFVSAISVPNRHGLTLAELLRYRGRFGPAPIEVRCIEVQGWSRDRWADQTGQVWVMPSPNMPTLDTAAVYPGMCLLEATNLSEGRGTTRPFELFGAPYIEAWALAEALNGLALPGVAFRAAAFKPGFQKWAGNLCHGAQVHVTDRVAFRPYETGLSVVWMVHHMYPERFAWRADPYEFVTDIPAMDLLCGTDRVRLAIERGARRRAVVEEALSGGEPFAERRREVLIYR